jgi:hypothetical protein
MQQSTCRYDPKKSVARIKGYVKLESDDEKVLASAIAKIGPISVAVDFSSPQLQFYKKGIYYDENCKKDYASLNHAVAAVGYGQTKQGEMYYIIK